jgi:hypothetical protein
VQNKFLITSSTPLPKEKSTPSKLLSAPKRPSTHCSSLPPGIEKIVVHSQDDDDDEKYEIEPTQNSHDSPFVANLLTRQL